MADDLDTRTRYFNELTLRLREASFSPQVPTTEGTLPVEWAGKPLCQVTSQGGVIFKPSDVSSHLREQACARVNQIAGAVAEYIQLMETAPQLKASGLDGDYRILADFNDTILAGHPTQYGVTFVTWDWGYNHQGLCHGHYYEGSYQEAKQDFAARSELVPRDALFSCEQLTMIHDAIDFQREMCPDLSYESEQQLDKLLEQVERLIPEPMEQAPPTEPKMGGMV